MYYFYHKELTPEIKEKLHKAVDDSDKNKIYESNSN